MRQHTDLMAAVYNALGTGHRNARTRAELCAALGCNDRELREAIEALRWERPIITNDDGTGYYIPTQDSRGWAEASMWLSRQNKRQKSIKRATRGARLFMAQIQEGITLG